MTIAKIYKLSQLGVNGTFLDTLKNDYDGALSRVRTANGCTEFFHVPLPWLRLEAIVTFPHNYFLSSLTDHFIHNNIRGIQISDTDINCLMYVDDIVLIADAPFVLQNMLNALSDYCDVWDVVVNLDKQKQWFSIMVVLLNVLTNCGIKETSRCCIIL